MNDTQFQIDHLIELAVLQRAELKTLVDSMPQLRDHLSEEIERNLEEAEPAIRSELEQLVIARAKVHAVMSAPLKSASGNRHKNVDPVRFFPEKLTLPSKATPANRISRSAPIR